MALQRIVRIKRALHPAFDAMEDRMLCSITVIVPGTANPYLADPANDSGPIYATDGTKPPSIDVSSDSILTFSVTGGTTNASGSEPIEPPDGGNLVSAYYGARGAISSWRLPISSLAGVFLGPTLGSAPSEYTGSLSATTIAPPLGQVFFIGDGLTGHESGATQDFDVPSGATTLFLVDIDGQEWSDNGGKFDVIVTPAPVPTPTPTPTGTPTPMPTPTPISTLPPTSPQNPIGTSGPTPTTPSVTPPPAARPLPAGFLRTPPKVAGITTKMVDRTPEILIQLNQGIVPELALEKDRYRVDASGAEGALGTSSGDSHIKISRVVYRAKTDTITLMLPRKPMVQGNVVLTVDANGIANLLGQELEGDNVDSGVNLIREVDLP
jgi:hypothetical protein